MNAAARGSFILTAAMIVAGLLIYAFHVVLAWLLSPEAYGVFGVYTALLMVSGFFVESGFPPTVAKFLAEEREDKPKILRTALLGNLMLGIVIVTILYFITRAVNLGEEYNSIILVLVLTLLMASLYSVSRHALQGLFRFNRMGAVEVFVRGMMLLFGVVLVLLGLGVFGAVLGIAIATFFGLALALFWLRDTRFWQGKDLAGLGIYNFVAPMFFSSLCLTLVMYIDILGVKLLVTSEELVGYYLSAITLVKAPVVIAWGVIGAVFPFISKYARRDEARLYITTSLKYSLLFLVPMLVTLMVAPKPLLTLFFPEQYSAAANALAIISLGMIFLIIINIIARSFQALGNPRIPALFLAPVVPAQILLLYFLVPRYGLVGAASATTIACFIGLIPMLWMSFRYKISLGFDPRMLFSWGILAALLYFYPYYNGQIRTVLALLLAGLVYIVSLRVFRLLKKEDVAIILAGIYLEEKFIPKKLAAIIGFMVSSGEKDEA